MIGPCAKDMVCHGDAFNVAWRIAPRAQGRLGRPRPHRARASRASIELMFEQSENVAIALASWATESSEARGSVLLNCSLSYLFKETSTIGSTMERNVASLSGPLSSCIMHLPALRGVAYRSICICACSYILIAATVQGTSCKLLKKTEEQA